MAKLSKGNKQTKEISLSRLAGVYDVTINDAKPEARVHRDLSKDGKSHKASQKETPMFDDEKARAERFAGIFY
jgi:hypothetical protein